MITAADFLVMPGIFWAAPCMRSDRACASTEEPEEQSHQQQRDEIHPARHRDQRNAEERAFKRPLSELGERKCRSRLLKHLGLLDFVDFDLFVRAHHSRTNSTIS